VEVVGVQRHGNLRLLSSFGLSGPSVSLRASTLRDASGGDGGGEGGAEGGGEGGVDMRSFGVSELKGNSCWKHRWSTPPAAAPPDKRDPRPASARGGGGGVG